MFLSASFAFPNSGLHQDIVFFDLQSEGEQRRPCIFGNFELRRFFMETSILEYSQNVDKWHQLPDWTKTYGE
jgi:hypothetical protein